MQLEAIKLKLKGTVEERGILLKQGVNIFDYFPFYFYKTELILYDFEIQYEAQSKNLLSNWHSYSDQIENVLHLTTGDDYEKFGTWNPTIKSFLGFLALLKLLPPTLFGKLSKQTKRFTFEKCVELIIQFEDVRNINNFASLTIFVIHSSNCLTITLVK